MTFYIGHRRVSGVNICWGFAQTEGRIIGYDLDTPQGRSSLTFRHLVYQIFGNIFYKSLVYKRLQRLLGTLKNRLFSDFWAFFRIFS